MAQSNSEKYRKLAQQWEEEYIRQQEEKAKTEKKRTQEQIVAEDRRRKREMRATISEKYKQQGAQQRKEQAKQPAAGNSGGRQTIAQAMQAQGVVGLPLPGFNQNPVKDTPAGYLASKFAGGAAQGVEGLWNAFVDMGQMNAARELEEAQNRLKMSGALLGGQYKALADDARMKQEQVLAGLPDAAQAMRAGWGTRYNEGIDKHYGEQSGVLGLAGNVAAGVGGMATAILSNAVIPGSGLAVTGLQAAGNAAQEARQGGADDNTAALYGLLSGGVELATEKMFGGIPGLPKGWADDVLARIAASRAGRGAIKRIVDVLGEGAEEYISEVAGAYLKKMWNGDERGAWQTFAETQPDALYSGLVGALTSGVMNLPGDVSNAVETRRAGRAAQQGGHTDAVISAGLNLPTDSEGYAQAAQLAQRRLDGGTPRTYELGMLARDVQGLPMVQKAQAALTQQEQQAQDAAQRKTAPATQAGAESALDTAENMARFAREVDGVFDGSKSPTEVVKLGMTPQLYEQYGAQLREMTIKPEAMRKIAYPEGYMGGKHNLGIPALKQLPQQLQNPVALLRSQSQPNSLVVLTEWADAQGRPVIVPLHLDKQGAVSLENMVASAYGRNGIEAMLGENDANVLWTKGNEGIRQILSNRLQLPQAVSDDTLVSNYSIPNGQGNVNGGQIKRIARNGGQTGNFPAATSGNPNGEALQSFVAHPQSEEAVALPPPSARTSSANPTGKLVHDAKAPYLTAEPSPPIPAGNEGIDQILSHRLQLPQAVSDDTLVSNYSIPNGQGNVNSQNGPFGLPMVENIDKSSFAEDNQSKGGANYAYRNDFDFAEWENTAQQDPDARGAGSGVGENATGYGEVWRRTETPGARERRVLRTDEVSGRDLSVDAVAQSAYDEAHRQLSQQAQADGVKLYFTDDNPQVYEGRDVFRAPKEALSDAESGSMLAAYGADPAGYYEHEMYHINRERNPAMARRAERLIAVSIDQQSSLFKWYEQHLLKGYAERGVKIGFDDVMEELAANVSHDYLTHGTVSEKYSRYFEGGRVPDKVLEALRALREAQKSSAAGTGDAPQGRARTTPYGPNTVGAAQMNERGYSHLQNEYGTIKPGENPARTVDVPKRTEKGNRVSQFTRTEMEAAATPDSLIEHFEKSVEEGLFSYRPLSDQKALDSAVQTIEDTGFSTAVKLFERAVDGGGAVNKKDMVLGQVLYAEAAAAGDTATAMRLAAELAAAGTKAGQSVQALRMLKKLTPEGKLYYLEKSVQQLNNQRLAPIEKKNERRAKAGAEPLAGPEQITIREELARRLLDAKGEKQVKEAETAIIKDVARQLPATWTDKWNAWRYLSMLGNPRTHIRNIIGNAAFIPARSLKNNIGALIERAALPVGERTKAVLNPVSKADKARKAFARGDFETMSDVVTGGGKLNPQQVIESEKPIFKNKLLEAARKFNGNALEAEDAFFLKGAYADSMAQYMKANRLTQADMKGGVLEKARSYAISEAQKATYRDASAVSQALNDFKRKNKVTQVLGEGLLPFTKTPINILKRGIEYSPAGLLKSLTADAVLVRKGNMSANEMIDHMAAGMSGTMVTALGMWLAHMGLLSGGLGDDKEEKFKKDQGAQEYALTIGNKSYTLDWAAPTALPFFVGVEVEKQLAMDGEAMNFKRAVEALSHIAEPVYNMSMLQGVENLFGSFSETGAISDAMMDTAAGYLSQAVPTLLGQVARTVDDTRRNSYYNDKTTPLPYKVQTALNKNLAKLPIASKTLPAKVNVWGEEMESGKGGTLGRLAQNMLSPGYYGEMRDTPLDREVLRVYKQTGEGKALPTAPQKYMEYKGARHDLSAKEYEQFAKTKGQTQKALAEKVIGLPIYKNSSDDTKADILQDVYAYGSYVARKEYLPEYEKTGWEQKAYEAKKQGIAPETYLQFRYEADTDGQGGVSMREAGEYLRGSNLRQEQKEALWRQAASDEAVGKFETAKKEGLGDVYLQMLWEADTGSSKDPSGGPNGSLSKAEIQAYLDAARLEQDAKRLLFSLASTAKNPY